MALPWAEHDRPLMLGPMQGLTNRVTRAVMAEASAPDVLFTEFVRVRPQAKQVIAFNGCIPPPGWQVEEANLLKDHIDIVIINPVLASANHQILSLKQADIIAIPEGMGRKLSVDLVNVSLHLIM